MCNIRTGDDRDQWAAFKERTNETIGGELHLAKLSDSVPIA